MAVSETAAAASALSPLLSSPRTSGCSAMPCASSPRARSGPGSSMDAEAAIRPESCCQCFELGLMGIEVPETYGGAGGTFFIASWRRGDRAGRPLGGRAGRRAEHAGQQRAPALGHRGAEAALPARGSPRRRSAPTRCREAGSGSDAFALARAPSDEGDHWVLNGRKLWITNARRGRALHRLRQRRSGAGLQGHHRVPGRARRSRLLGRQEGGQARHPRVEHLRARPRRLPRSRGERARRGRQGLQDRDRDAQRGPHRHRRADARPRAGRARARASPTRRSASSSASRSPSSRAMQFQLAESRRRSKRRGCWSTTPRG